MKVSRGLLCGGLALIMGIPAISLFSFPAAAEETVLLCEGNTRNTARVYRRNGTLMMRIFDRQTNAVWFNSSARQATNPESIIYTNVRGEGQYQVSTFRNGGRDCSIIIGTQAPERGTVRDGSGGNPSPAAEQTVLLCEGSVRNTARVYRSNGSLQMRIHDRRTNRVWFNGAARDETNPESNVYSNERGEGRYQVSAFRNGGRDCSITIGTQPLERGTVRERSQ